MRLIPQVAASLFALGALTACGGGGPPFSGLDVSNPVLTSGYTDNNGNPLICNNLDTPMEFDFLYVGDLRSLVVSLVGVRTGQFQGINVTSRNIANGNGAVTFTVPAGTAPQRVRSGVAKGGVRPQSIIVSPNVIGYSVLQMQAFGAGGATDVLSSNAVPVISNCF